MHWCRASVAIAVANCFQRFASGRPAIRAGIYFCARNDLLPLGERVACVDMESMLRTSSAAYALIVLAL